MAYIRVDGADCFKFGAHALVGIADENVAEFKGLSRDKTVSVREHIGETCAPVPIRIDSHISVGTVFIVLCVVYLVVLLLLPVDRYRYNLIRLLQALDVFQRCRIVSIVFRKVLAVYSLIVYKQAAFRHRIVNLNICVGIKIVVKGIQGAGHASHAGTCMLACVRKSRNRCKALRRLFPKAPRKVAGQFYGARLVGELAASFIDRLRADVAAVRVGNAGADVQGDGATVGARLNHQFAQFDVTYGIGIFGVVRCTLPVIHLDGKSDFKPPGGRIAVQREGNLVAVGEFVVCQQLRGVCLIGAVFRRVVLLGEWDTVEESQIVSTGRRLAFHRIAAAVLWNRDEFEKRRQGDGNRFFGGFRLAVIGEFESCDAADFKVLALLQIKRQHVVVRIRRHISAHADGEAAVLVTGRAACFFVSGGIRLFLVRFFRFCICGVFRLFAGGAAGFRISSAARLFLDGVVVCAPVRRFAVLRRICCRSRGNQGTQQHSGHGHAENPPDWVSAFHKLILLLEFCA